MNLVPSSLLNTVLAVLPCSLIWSSQVLAEINMKDASYSKTWIDIQVDGDSLTRTYESRSTHNGLFGFGWCSPLETKLSLQAERIKLIQCGVDFEFVKTDSRFTSLFPTLGEITRINNQFTHRRPDGSIQRFDSAGRLVAWAQAGREETRVYYSGDGFPQEVLAGSGEVLRFRIDPVAKRVTRVEGAGGQTVEYAYQGDDLARVKNAWRNEYTYQYDKLHNLTRINYPDKTHESLTYNPDRDWVTSFRGRNGCNETYRYESLPSSRQRSPAQFASRATAIKACPQRPKAKASFEFWHERSSSGPLVLAKTRVERNGKTTVLHYHPVTGLVTQVVKNEN